MFREKHKAGGQSQRRFDRVIDLAAHEFKKRIGEHMNEDFLALEELEGVIIGGPGFTKEEFVKGDYLNYEIKDKFNSYCRILHILGNLVLGK